MLSYEGVYELEEEFPIFVFNSIEVRTFEQRLLLWFLERVQPAEATLLIRQELLD